MLNIFKTRKEKNGDSIKMLMKEIAEINKQSKEAVKQLEILNEKMKEINVQIKR